MARARYQFRSELQGLEPKRRVSFFGWQSRWADSLVIVFFSILLGSGTITAASYSMPDNLLYPVKLATEQVRVQLTPTDIGKVELYVELADKRVNEIVSMAGEGKAEKIAVATQQLDKLLVSVAVLAGGQVEERAVMTAPTPTPTPTPVPAPIIEVPPKEEDSNGGALPAAPSAPAPVPPLSPSPDYEKSEAVIPQLDDERVELRTLLLSYAIDHQAILSDLLDESPESVKTALQQAINVSEMGYERALRALEESR